MRRFRGDEAAGLALRGEEAASLAFRGEAAVVLRGDAMAILRNGEWRRLLSADLGDRILGEAGFGAEAVAVAAGRERCSLRNDKLLVRVGEVVVEVLPWFSLDEDPPEVAVLSRRFVRFVTEGGVLTTTLMDARERCGDVTGKDASGAGARGII